MKTEAVSYSQGSDKGILLPSSSTVIATTLARTRVSDEGLMVCNEPVKSRQNHLRHNQDLTIVTTWSSVTSARSRTAASTSLDHFKPTPPPKGLVLVALTLYDVPPASRSAALISAISFSIALIGLGAVSWRLCAAYPSGVKSCLDVAKIVSTNNVAPKLFVTALRVEA